MKKAFCFFMLILFIALSFSSILNASNYSKSVHSNNAVVYNIENNKFVFEKNSKERISPVSIAKIMTGILALEHYGASLDKEITVIYSMIKGIDGYTTMNLKVGEKVKVNDLLFGMLVGGANDAAQVLAFDIASNEAMFAIKMNEKAKELGANETNFKNASGIDHLLSYTTARDMALICASAYNNSKLMEYLTTKRYDMAATNKTSERTIWTRNHLISNHNQLKYLYSDAIGMISGYSEESGYLVASAVKSTFTYICIATGSGKDSNGDIGAYYDVKNLLKWAKDEYEIKRISISGTVVTEIPVTLGDDYNHVTIVTKDFVYSYLPKDFDITKIETIIELNENSLEAPVEKGEVVGNYKLMLDGELLGQTELITKYSIKKSDSQAIKENLSNFFSSSAFTLLLLGLVVIFLIIGFIIYTKYTRKK